MYTVFWSFLSHIFFYFSDESKGYTNLGSITVGIEDPDEEPQIEKPEECVYYNNLSVAKDVSVSDLLNIITTKQAKENEGFLKEFKVTPTHTHARAHTHKHKQFNFCMHLVDIM